MVRVTRLGPIWEKDVTRRTEEEDQDSYLWTYDLYARRNDFYEGQTITRASGRGLGPGNRYFLGPVKWHRTVRRMPFIRCVLQPDLCCRGHIVSKNKLRIAM